MFIVNGDGTYTVRFYHNGAADYVTVDSSLPVDQYGRLVFNGNGSYANSAANVLWVASIAKIRRPRAARVFLSSAATRWES